MAIQHRASRTSTLSPAYLHSERAKHSLSLEKISSHSAKKENGTENVQEEIDFSQLLTTLWKYPLLGENDKERGECTRVLFQKIFPLSHLDAKIQLLSQKDRIELARKFLCVGWSAAQMIVDHLDVFQLDHAYPLFDTFFWKGIAAKQCVCINQKILCHNQKTAALFIVSLQAQGLESTYAIEYFQAALGCLLETEIKRSYIRLHNAKFVLSSRNVISHLFYSLNCALAGSVKRPNLKPLILIGHNLKDPKNFKKFTKKLIKLPIGWSELFEEERSALIDLAEIASTYNDDAFVGHVAKFIWG